MALWCSGNRDISSVPMRGFDSLRSQYHVWSALFALVLHGTVAQWESWYYSSSCQWVRFSLVPVEQMSGCFFCALAYYMHMALWCSGNRDISSVPMRGFDSLRSQSMSGLPVFALVLHGTMPRWEAWYYSCSCQWG